LDHLKGDRIHYSQFSGIESVNPPSVIPQLDELATAVAAQLDAGGPIPALCERLRVVLADALRSEAFVALFTGRERSFEAYRDPHRGFVIHASVHKPGHRTPGHDHAEAWAVYGMYRGVTAYRLFDRGADRAPGLASLRLLEEERAAPPGSVAVVLPGQVHENWNPGDELAWNLVLRPRPLAELWRRAFDVETGRYHPMRRAG
jgi:predicted metal-dependent enzyme (double-stranded beta helix superfamily)